MIKVSFTHISSQRDVVWISYISLNIGYANTVYIFLYKYGICVYVYRCTHTCPTPVHTCSLLAPRRSCDSPVPWKLAPPERSVVWQQAPCFWGADFTSRAPCRAWAQIIRCSPNRKEETSKRKGRAGFVFQIGSQSLCVASSTATMPTNKSWGYLIWGSVFKIEGKIAWIDYIQWCIACQKVWEVRIVGTGKDWGVPFKHALGTGAAPWTYGSFRDAIPTRVQ